jgi:limonene-1,2-epoxide hydrolase
VLDQPDQLGVIEVEAEVLIELADGGQVVVERLLNVALGRT